LEYLVSIEREGKQVLVGTIGGEDSGAARFSYVEKYLNDPDAAAISIHLPLQKEAFSPADTKLYFEGLLPEGFTRRSVAQWMHLDENDYLSILHGLGRECLGAVRVSAPEDRPEEAYESVSAEQVQALAAEGATRSAEMVTKAHLSLTGASGKVGLYFDSKSEK
jgi:serine/threonine-protein kinase HipA